MNVTAIKNGLVIDHIKAGTGWRIFRRLGLDASPFTSALIMNVPLFCDGTFMMRADVKEEASRPSRRKMRQPVPALM